MLGFMIQDGIAVEFGVSELALVETISSTWPFWVFVSV